MAFFIPYADTPEDRAAAFGFRLKAEELLGANLHRASARARREWRRTFRREHRAWQRNWKEQWSRNWGRQWQHHMAQQTQATPGAGAPPPMMGCGHAFLGISLPLVAIVNAAMFVAWILVMISAFMTRNDLRLAAAGTVADVGLAADPVRDLHRAHGAAASRAPRPHGVGAVLFAVGVDRGSVLGRLHRVVLLAGVSAHPGSARAARSGAFALAEPTDVVCRGHASAAALIEQPVDERLRLAEVTRAEQVQVIQNVVEVVEIHATRR